MAPPPTTPLFFFFLLLLSLAQEQENKNSNSTTISPPTSQQLDPRFNPSMAVLIVVLVTAFFFVAFFSIYIRQCGGNLGTGGGGGQRGAISRLSRGGGPRRGIDSSVIDRLPTLLYSDVKGHRIGKHDSPLECAVCLSDFADSDLLRLIPHCSHAFHPNCIDLWLSSHSTCPVCRHDLSSSSFSSPSSADVSVHIVDDDPPSFDPLPPAPLPPPPPPPPPPTTAPPPPPPAAAECWGEEERERRFTLRLPEKVRREVMEGRLNRSVSMVALPVVGEEGSTRRGGGGGGSSRGGRRRQQVWVVKSDRWAFLGRTLTWPKKDDCSVKGGGGGGGAEEGSVGREGSSKGYVMRSPLHCLGGDNGFSDEEGEKNLEVEEEAVSTINRGGGGHS